MLRQLLIAVSLWIVATVAMAGEAGRIVFVVGKAHVDQRAIVLGDVIQEGAELATGADGYVYLKTIDDGFFILRPNSTARVTSYHIDTQNPTNTHVKLELLQGVVRTISGQGVKQARQNFRFNTPVAAIGVRGTDFTVFTDQHTSRIAVLSGGVVVSGFAGACGPEGRGPCEGAASKELFANQVGQLLQVRKGESTPQLLNAHGNSPDLSAPPRQDEPVAKVVNAGAASLSVNDVNLDAQKGANLILNAKIPSLPAPVQPITLEPLVSPVTPVPARQVTWGRWQSVADQAANVELSKVAQTNGQILALNNYFVLLRSTGADWQMPSQGTLGFSLKQSEAYILNESSQVASLAKIDNAQLKLDFTKAAFVTSFDLTSKQKEKFAFYANGDLSKDGQLLGAGQFAVPTNMAVSGAVGDGGVGASYIFRGRIDDKRIAVGATSWLKN